MAANLAVHTPIVQVQNKANTTPFTNALPEKAGQTFLFGSPVQLNAGYVQAWDGTTVAAGILGVSESFGQNLATNGAGAPTPPWGQITGVGAISTYGTVPNEPLGVNIALGSPVADGRTLFMEPNQDNIFEALFDNSSFSVPADGTPTNTDVGVAYGLTKDTSGYWYVDKAKATVGTNAVVQIVGLDPVFGSVLNAPVKFVFIASAVQVI